jgi:ornithine cyclodeaminase/alanine dehydrogenase-like protein (mu-crystallin family)
MLILDEAQVRPHLTYEGLIPALEQALVRFSTGAITQPVRSVLAIPEHNGGGGGRFGLMPVVDGDLMAVKLVTVFEKNTTLPTHQAAIQLFSAAVTAIAARLFTPQRPLTVAILGSGVQARSHLAALKHVRELREVRVWSRTPANAGAFGRETGALPMELKDAVRGADLVIGVANVSQPLILGKYLADTTFVAAIAAVGARRRELDDEAMQASVVVESREAALRESGDIIASGAPIYTELGEILGGKIGLPPDGCRVVYKGLGIAAEDLAAARIVYEAASR